MLSTPPAFVLSQNQTLEFNCLKPSAPFDASDCSNVFSSFADCSFGIYMLLYILSKNKLTETFLFMNTFVFVVCFNSFPSIRFLICVGKLPFARVPSCDSLPILPHRFHFCQAFLIPFSKYFFAFSSGFLALRLSRQPLAQFACLSYHFYSRLSTLFRHFF